MLMCARLLGLLRHCPPAGQNGFGPTIGHHIASLQPVLFPHFRYLSESPTHSLPLCLTPCLSLSASTEYVQTGPYNRAYTESQLEAGGGFILPDFNEEQVNFWHGHLDRREPFGSLSRGFHSFQVFNDLTATYEALIFIGPLLAALELSLTSQSLNRVASIKAVEVSLPASCHTLCRSTEVQKGLRLMITSSHCSPLPLSLPPESVRQPTRACSSPTSTVAPGSTCCAWPAGCLACRTCGCATAAKKTSCSTTGTTCCRPVQRRTRPSSSGRKQFTVTALSAFIWMRLVHVSHNVSS